MRALRRGRRTTSGRRRGTANFDVATPPARPGVPVSPSRDYTAREALLVRILIIARRVARRDRAARQLRDLHADVESPLMRGPY